MAHGKPARAAGWDRSVDSWYPSNWAGRREDRHREQGGDAVNGSMVPPNSDSEESESVTDDDEMSHDSESAESEEVWRNQQCSW